MNTIVLDLEFTQIYDPSVRKICSNEIIQIGAVKLDSNNNIIDRFDSFVRPLYSKINKKVYRLTGITDSMVERAAVFDEVFTGFLDWIGDDDYTIISWSEEDLRVIIGECNLNGFFDYRMESMLLNWEDLQAAVGNILGISQQLSLEKVLKAINMEFEGTAHRAIDDAENTARVYVLTTNKEETKKVLGSLVELFMPKEDLSFSMGSLFDGFVCKTA